MIGVYGNNPDKQRQHVADRQARQENKRAEAAARLERLTR